MSRVRVETASGVMTVTLADVENRNALGAALVQGLHDAIAAANADSSVRAVVVTNEGNTFCAGANLKERSGARASRAPSVSFEGLLQAVQNSPTPVLGRIAGHVVGGGNGLAAAFDIAIAADHVQFGFTEVRLGVAIAGRKPLGLRGNIIGTLKLPGYQQQPGQHKPYLYRIHIGGACTLQYLDCCVVVCSSYSISRQR